jgi:hypothetical protein
LKVPPPTARGLFAKLKAHIGGKKGGNKAFEIFTLVYGGKRNI